VREDHKIKVRQPLPKLTVVHRDARVREAVHWTACAGASSPARWDATPPRGGVPASTRSS
jgi:hypothetical protein